MIDRLSDQSNRPTFIFIHSNDLSERQREGKKLLWRLYSFLAYLTFYSFFFLYLFLPIHWGVEGLSVLLDGSFLYQIFEFMDSIDKKF
jgi:hypothetical protein